MNRIIRIIIPALLIIFSGCSLIKETPNRGRDSAHIRFGTFPHDPKSSGDSAFSTLSHVAYKKTLESEYYALQNLPVGKAIIWENKKTGEHGELVSEQVYHVGSQTCKQIIHTIFGQGKSNLIRRTACRSENGDWLILD